MLVKVIYYIAMLETRYRLSCDIMEMIKLWCTQIVGSNCTGGGSISGGRG